MAHFYHLLKCILSASTMCEVCTILDHGTEAVQWKSSRAIPVAGLTSEEGDKRAMADSLDKLLLGK